MDKSAHNLYLSRLAAEGFVVASVEYCTSNEGKYPAQIQDVKAAIRYLRAMQKGSILMRKRLALWENRQEVILHVWQHWIMLQV